MQKAAGKGGCLEREEAGGVQEPACVCRVLHTIYLTFFILKIIEFVFEEAMHSII